LKPLESPKGLFGKRKKSQILKASIESSKTHKEKKRVQILQI